MSNDFTPIDPPEGDYLCPTCGRRGLPFMDETFACEGGGIEGEDLHEPMKLVYSPHVKSELEQKRIVSDYE